MLFLLLSILVLLLLYLSLVEGAVTRLTRLGLNLLTEQKNHPALGLLEEIARDRRRFLLPLQLGLQCALVSAAVLTTCICFYLPVSMPALSALIASLLVWFLFRILLPRLVLQNRAKKVLLKLLPSFRFVYSILSNVTRPIVSILEGFRRREEGKHPGPAPTDEFIEKEIQAYLDVGAEEGIFESADAELIQSALEFGSTLVREIMTPRSEIVTIDERATVKELKALMVSAKHSRIPVFRDSMDQIVGVVYVRNLLSILERESEELRILPIVKEVLIVPETKHVAALLKEMQARAEQMALVVNEYGTISGLVTVEDLLEEIVGDIRDEDESRYSDVVYEGEGKYIVRGRTEIEKLEDLVGLKFGEEDASTVSGFVVERMGRVPRVGEMLDLAGSFIEILSSDQRRVHTVRVRLASKVRSESFD